VSTFGIVLAYNVIMLGKKGIVLPSTDLNSPFAVPECLTPMVQHCSGGLDAMMMVCYGFAGIECLRRSLLVIREEDGFVFMYMYLELIM